MGWYRQKFQDVNPVIYKVIEKRLESYLKYVQCMLHHKRVGIPTSVKNEKVLTTRSCYLIVVCPFTVAHIIMGHVIFYTIKGVIYTPHGIERVKP